MNSQTAALHGSRKLAAQKLHSALTQRPEGFEQIVRALRANGHKHLADKLNPHHKFGGKGLLEV